MAAYSLKNIIKLANDLGIQDQYVIPYGWDMAKIDLTAEDFKNKKDGKLVLVKQLLLQLRRVRVKLQRQSDFMMGLEELE